MKTKSSQMVCPAEISGVLDFKLRNFFHNPKNIFKPYVRKGMKIIDLGCGPGFFTMEIARMTGKSGKVIAADIQGKMLAKLKNKIKESELEKIIKLHRSQPKKISISEKVDLIIIFFMLHEVPDQEAFLKEAKGLLKPGGKIFIAEPKFHVTKKNFMRLIELIKKLGFKIVENPKVFLSRSLLLKK